MGKLVRRAASTTGALPLQAQRRRPGNTAARQWAAGLGTVAALLLGHSAVQASAQAERMPAIQAAPMQPPTIELTRERQPAGPTSSPGARQPTTAPLDRNLGPTPPELPRTLTRPPKRNDPALQRELARLRRTAEPASGFGSTNAAANAAWTLGLIELHGGVAQRSPAQAQTWFERATRLGRQPLANAGLAWCYIEGCKGPPDPAAARQAIAKLRPRYRGRALYLEWLLNTRLAPLSVRSFEPQGVTSLELPMRDLLLRAASDGDAQARIELGLEAVTNGDLIAARDYFKAAAPKSRAAAANLELLDATPVTPARPTESGEAERLLEQARRAHRGIGAPTNYVEALRLYQAAAAKGSAAASRMLAMITSRPLPDGSVNVGWMAQLAYVDTDNSLPQLDSRALATMMYRDPTPLFDLLPEAWQRRLTTPGR